MPGFVGTATSSDRYDNTHAKLRAAAFAALPDWSLCAHCWHRRGRRHMIYKYAKCKPDRNGVRRSALHYDHNDSNTGYIGFSDLDCNRNDGSAKGGRARARKHGPWRGQRTQQQPRPTVHPSRNW
jgi:hypothetical protein